MLRDTCVMVGVALLLRGCQPLGVQPRLTARDHARCHYDAGRVKAPPPLHRGGRG